VAAVTKVCGSCTEELLAKNASCDCDEGCDCGGDCQKEACSCGKKQRKKKAEYPVGEAWQEDLGQQSMRPIDENAPMQCQFCEKNGSHFEGNRLQVLDHINQMHQQDLQNERDQYNGAPAAPSVQASKEAAPELDEAIVEPLPQAPGDMFNDKAKDLANRAAAIQFSTLDEEKLTALASQVGLTPDEIRDQVQVVAIFDNYVGVNGQLTQSAPQAPEGYAEVSAENVYNTAQEAQVPTDIVTSKIAEQTGMEQDLAYNMIKDSYGGVDLDEVTKIPVQGEYRFYLPAQLAMNTSEVATQQGEVGPSMAAPTGVPQV
jgi:hypothetical protein